MHDMIEYETSRLLFEITQSHSLDRKSHNKRNNKYFFLTLIIIIAIRPMFLALIRLICTRDKATESQGLYIS